MKKSAVIIDTPDGCWNCSLCKRIRFSNDYFCSAAGMFVFVSEKPRKRDKPKQCPLKEIT